MEWSVSVFIGASLLHLVWSQDPPQVLTKQGLVNGSWASGGNYSEFLGIPYAIIDPENPFGTLLPAPTFNGTFEANDDGAICPQREEFNNTLAGSTDCLQVNVYVPSTASSEKKMSVMVYIFGGRFKVGFAGKYLYGPQYLMRHDVILVTLNYRLGPYGFMCLDIPSVPGNAGLKDQQAALRWVQENIEAFGGDPDSVTIFGNSAGGISIELHVLSPTSSGLFKQAILQSGNSLVPGTIVPSNSSVPIALAKQLGLEAETVEEAIQAIKNVSSDDLIKASENIGVTMNPCIEKSFEGVESFMTESPLDLLASGQYQTVPLLLGYNTDENLRALYFTKKNASYLDTLQDSVNDSLSEIFNFENQQQLESTSRIFEKFYFKNKTITEDNVLDLVKFLSDFNFLHPTERSTAYHLNNTADPIYKYVIGYNGQVNFWKQWKNFTAENGTAHGDEIGFLFKQIYMPDENTPEDQLIIDRVTTMWTNFAKYSDPTPKVTELLPVRWEPVTKEVANFLKIGSELVLDQAPFHERMAIWDLLFEAYGEYYTLV